MTVLLPFGLGVLAVAAVALAIAGFTGVRLVSVPRARLDALWDKRDRLARCGAAALAGSGVWLGTGWPVAAVAIAAAVLIVPGLVRQQDAQLVIARLEALQAWTRRITEYLRSGAGGLEQAIAASARTAPEPLIQQIAALAAGVRDRGLEPALRTFADELADPAADEVVMALILRTRAGGRGLTDVLDNKAAALAAEVAARREIEADRAKPRTNVRALIVITAVVLTGFTVFAHDYLAPLSTVLGQLVMAAAAGIFALAFWWMHSLTRTQRPARMLDTTEAGR
ncbi:type II secretion system F family protein [Amycolatopsis sp. NPDC059657]|uniref:type II secretion system F family protein n=1 Tax=Amycolatopsis sp. NPDC059657 TaxID=3346899 RepID=UPI00366FE282